MDLQSAFMHVLKRFITEWRHQDLLLLCQDVVQVASAQEVAEMLDEARRLPQCAGAFEPQVDPQTPHELLASALYDLLVINPTVKTAASAAVVCDAYPPPVEEVVLLVQDHFSHDPARPTLQMTVDTVLGLGWSEDDMNGLYLQVISQRGIDLSALDYAGPLTGPGYPPARFDIDFSRLQIDPNHTLAQHVRAVVAEGLAQIALVRDMFCDIRAEHERRMAEAR